MRNEDILKVVFVVLIFIVFIYKTWDSPLCETKVETTCGDIYFNRVSPWRSGIYLVEIRGQVDRCNDATSIVPLQWTPVTSLEFKLDDNDSYLSIDSSGSLKIKASHGNLPKLSFPARDNSFCKEAYFLPQKAAVAQV
jgi:hypothetical protein